MQKVNRADNDAHCQGDFGDFKRSLSKKILHFKENLLCCDTASAYAYLLVFSPIGGKPVRGRCRGEQFMLASKKQRCLTFFIPILISMIFVTMSSNAMAKSRHCNVEKKFEGSFVNIEQSFSETGDAEKFSIEYQMVDFQDTGKGSAFKVRLDDFGIGDVRNPNLPALMDNLMVGIQIRTEKHATEPAHFYFTRDGYIPIDIVSGKIWYPAYYQDDRPLEFITTLGDLERNLQLGPGEEPAKELGWVLTEIGKSPQAGSLIADGSIPITFIQAARSRVEELMQQVRKSDPLRPVC